MFPYLKLAPRVLLIDDCTLFIEALSDILPARLSPRLVLHPAEVDAALGNQDALLRAEQEIFSGLHGSTEEPCLLRALAYLRWEGRRSIYSVLVSDYAMPAESGVSLCARHKYLGLRRILLTGIADESLAVTAFNEGAIDHFLLKQTSCLAKDLLESIEGQSRQSSEVRSLQLMQLMPDSARRLFADPLVLSGLGDLLTRFDVVDYIVSVQPLGLMALSASGRALWIQIENEGSLFDLQEMAEASGWLQPEVQLISSGRWLANIDLVAQVGVLPSLVQGVPLAPGIYAAAFPISDSGGGALAL